MSDARVFAQPGVMDAATRTAVAAVVQADAAGGGARSSPSRAAARRAEAENWRRRGARGMRLAEDKLGEPSSAVVEVRGAGGARGAGCALAVHPTKL